MLRRTLNLGILAHVDAGKTTLTERLLYEAGAIDAPGSVDAGTTQTDTLALERERGITIRAAVASFTVGELDVNLIDTPGHPDFIAEVERALRVLDGAVLVVSAVEGVQAQTRVLARALTRLRVPTLVFVNKIDRRGADEERVLEAIERRLALRVVPLGSTGGTGTRDASFVRYDGTLRARVAETLAEADEDLLAALVDDPAAVSDERLDAALAAQVRQALVQPLVFGSALTGSGVGDLTAALALLPTGSGDPEAAVSGSVFKVERAPSGEKLAYTRLFAGTICRRDRVRFGEGHVRPVTSIGLVGRGERIDRSCVAAGEIAILGGLREIRIGDAVGEPCTLPDPPQFALPTLETVVVPCNPADGGRLRVALGVLAEQDPLIGVRLDDRRGELSVSLYGEVQTQVLQATLSRDFGLEVLFREATPVYVERPSRVGDAVELLHAPTNPFNASIGMRVEPDHDEHGISFRLDVDPRTIPLYVYKTVDSFRAHMARYVRDALAEGSHGWQVVGCAVTMTSCLYCLADGPPSKRGPTSTAADFRKLTPIVLLTALREARSVVCEPTVLASVEVPNDTLGEVMPVLGRLGASVRAQEVRGDLCTVDAVLRATQAHELQRLLPGLTRGEGVLEARPAGIEPVRGTPPERPRTTASPLDLDSYLAGLAGRR